MINEEKRKCGDCGYFMRYVKSNGEPDKYGDCGSIKMNKECNEGVNPFRLYEDNYVSILQVDKKEDACALFKENSTKRVREYIKKNSEYYFQV